MRKHTKELIFKIENYLKEQNDEALSTAEISKALRIYAQRIHYVLNFYSYISHWESCQVPGKTLWIYKHNEKQENTTK